MRRVPDNKWFLTSQRLLHTSVGTAVKASGTLAALVVIVVAGHKWS